VKIFVYAVLAGATSFGICASGCSSSSDSSSSPGAADSGAAVADAGSSSDGSTKDAATTADTGAKDAGTDAVASGCNALVNSAPESTQSTIASAAPAATGGTIVDGTYFLTEFNLYDPAGSASAPEPSGLKVTLAIHGNEMDSIQTLPDDSSDTFAETFVVSGTDLNRTLTCPNPGPDLQAVYSVTGNTLTIYETNATSQLVAGSVYVKQ
jgi:hypothetical protein